MRRANKPSAEVVSRSRLRDVSDAELMNAISTGDLGALGELYDRYHESIYQFARRASVIPSDADDVVHDAFLSVPRAAASYDGRPCARPFLIGITVHMLRRRSRGVVRWVEMLRRLRESYADAVPTPEEVALRAEDLARLDRALQRLSEEKRLVYLMIEREGLSGDEVATVLEIPLGTVWTRLHHARAALQRSLLRGNG